jgi:hypothetical protein
LPVFLLCFLSRTYGGDGIINGEAEGAITHKGDISNRKKPSAFPFYASEIHHHL